MKFFYTSCNICNKRSKGRICDDCQTEISLHRKKRKCLQCGRVIEANEESICRQCQTEKFNFDIAISVHPYSKAFKEALLDFKFHGGFFRAKIFGKLMGEAFIRSGLRADYIIPVPMRFWGLRKRGYNPPLEMGYCMKKIVKIPIITNGLIKTRKTAQQSTLTPEERKKNIKGAYKVNRRKINKIKGKEILLIDDVQTTGSTISECAKMLKQAGAASVNVITFLISDY